MTTPVRVRYAPSPTGHLHIGNSRTALFNYLFAKNLGGTMVVRIEDTDLKRNVAGGEESQLKFMKWLGIEWDESIDVGGAYGPYRQTERIDIYAKHTADLLERGLAYKCYCTEGELEAEREAQTNRGETPRYAGRCQHLSAAEAAAFEAEGRQASIRFRVPAGKTYAFDDMVKGHVTFTTEDMGDFVIVKKDGIPTYNFAVVIDDHLMAISHVLRGDDHINNTPRQLMIYEAFNWTPPVFGHMTLIVNEQHKKLSKRDESIIQFIEQYHDLGYLPEALFNFIALLGWSPVGEEEMFSREALIEAFTADRLSKSPAVFDTAKLAWMNNQYIKKADLDTVVGLCQSHLVAAGFVSATPSADEQAWINQLVALFQDRLNFGAEIVEHARLFFTDEVVFEDEAKAVVAEEQVPTVLAAFKAQLLASEAFDVEFIKAAIKQVQTDTGFKGKQLFMPIRAALTGQTHGADLNTTLVLLGRDKVLKRLG